MPNKPRWTISVARKLTPTDHELSGSRPQIPIIDPLPLPPPPGISPGNDHITGVSVRENQGSEVQERGGRTESSLVYPDDSHVCRPPRVDVKTILVAAVEISSS